MKILIGTLLFASAILINYPESNAMWSSNRGGSSLPLDRTPRVPREFRRSRASTSNAPPQPSEAGAFHSNFDENFHPESEFPERIETKILRKKIVVYLRNIEGQYVAINSRVVRPTTRIPTGSNKRSLNFMTQAVFKWFNGHAIKFVIYIEENAQNQRTLLGAKLPPSGHIDDYEGDPRLLNPDQSEWFITYEGRDYRVEVNPTDDKLLDITLYGLPNTRPSRDKILENWHQYECIHFAGVYFLVFRNAQRFIEGAALDPLWMYRPGEPLGDQNPYLHPDLYPHPILPEQLNPWLHRNLNQDLNQYQKLDYPNIFNPRNYVYEQRHIRPDQQYAHEHAHPRPRLDQYQDPHHPHIFESSQHYLEPGAHQPPAFELNQNLQHQQNLGPIQHYPQPGAYQHQHFDLNEYSQPQDYNSSS